MKFVDLLKLFYKWYPAFWKWLLPERSPSLILLLNEPVDDRKTNVKRWRETWEWTGILVAVFIFPIEGIWWPWSFVVFGLVILLISWLLTHYFPVRDSIAVARLASCGAFWIFVAFLLPLAWWGIVDISDTSSMKLWSPPIPRPWQHIVGYLSISGVLSAVNFAIVRYMR
jgi:hypothetical protein